LELLGENIPKGHIAIPILKELIIHLLHSLNKDRYIKKIRKNVAEEKREIAQILLTLGWMYVLSDIGKFICSTLRLLNICEAKIGKSKELGFALFGYGGICIAIPLFKRAIISFNRGLDIRKELADEWGIAQIYQGLGICYSWMGQHHKSLETLHQSREKFEKLGDIWELAMVYKVLGKGYRRISDYQKGIDNYSQYLKMSYKINDQQGISAANINISYSYIETGAFENAEKSLKESLHISRDIDNKLNYCEANAVYGYLEFERKNYDEAIKYLETAVQIDKKNRLLREFAVVVYHNITEAYIEKFKVQSKDLSKKEKTAQLKKIKTLY
jgi:tetratricopeptide (TPR) repeat protein